MLPSSAHSAASSAVSELRLEEEGLLLTPLLLLVGPVGRRPLIKAVLGKASRELAAHGWQQQTQKIHKRNIMKNKRFDSEELRM